MTNGIRATDFSDMTNNVSIDFPFTPYSSNSFENPNFYHPYDYTPPPSSPYIKHSLQPPPEPPYQFYYTTHIPTHLPLTNGLPGCFTYQAGIQPPLTSHSYNVQPIQSFYMSSSITTQHYQAGATFVQQSETFALQVFDEISNSRMQISDAIIDNMHQIEEKITKMLHTLENMGKILADSPKLVENKMGKCLIDMSKPVKENLDEACVEIKVNHSNLVNQSTKTPTPVLFVANQDILSNEEKVIDVKTEGLKLFQVREPAKYAPQVFDISTETDLIAFPVDQSNKELMKIDFVYPTNRFDNILIYKLHENEYDKVFRKFSVDFRIIVNAIQVFEGLSDKDRVDLVMPLFELVRKYGNMGGSEYRGNMQIRALVAWNTKMHLYVKSGKVVHGFATYCEQILKRSIHEFFPGEQNCDMLTKEWYFYRKLDVARLLFDVWIWYRCWNKDNKMICHRLHEDELGKLLVGSRKSELDHELLDKSIQLKVVVKYSSGTGHMKCVYLDPMPSLFYQVYAACNMWCNRGKSKFRAFFYLIFPSRDFDNFENLFNQNFSSRDCTCEGLYPDVDVKGQVEMIQCCPCEELLSQEHIGFESPDEIFRDEELVHKMFIGKYSKIISVKHDTIGGIVASHGFSQVMYVMFKEMKNAVITLDDITNWCILSSCAREGLAKEDQASDEDFPAKTEYKIIGLSENFCKNTPEHLLKQVIEKTYLGSGNVEMFEGKREVYLVGKEKLNIEFSNQESVYKLRQKEDVAALCYLCFYFKVRNAIMTAGKVELLVPLINSGAYASHSVQEKNVHRKLSPSEVKSIYKGGSLIALDWSVTEGVHETVNRAPRTHATYSLNAARPVDDWELLVLIHLCASLILQMMRFGAALTLHIGASFVFITSVPSAYYCVALLREEVKLRESYAGSSWLHP